MCSVDAPTLGEADLSWPPMRNLMLGGFYLRPVASYSDRQGKKLRLYHEEQTGRIDLALWPGPSSELTATAWLAAGFRPRNHARHPPLSFTTASTSWSVSLLRALLHFL